MDERRLSNSFWQTEMRLRLQDAAVAWGVSGALFLLVTPACMARMKDSSVGLEALAQMGLLLLALGITLIAGLSPLLAFVLYPSARRRGRKKSIRFSNFTKPPAGREAGNVLIRLAHPLGALRPLAFLGFVISLVLTIVPVWGILTSWVCLALMLSALGDIWLEVDLPRRRLVRQWHFLGESVLLDEGPADSWSALAWGATESASTGYTCAWLCALSRGGDIVRLTSVSLGEDGTHIPPPADASRIALHLGIPLLDSFQPLTIENLDNMVRQRNVMNYFRAVGDWEPPAVKPQSERASLPPGECW